MASTITDRLNFTSRLVQANVALLDALDELRNLSKEWGATGIGSDLQDADFEGTAHAGLTAADVVGLVTADAGIETYLTSNFIYTNLYKAR